MQKSRTIRRGMLFLLLLCFVTAAFAQDPNVAKANELIKQAREAIGGEANLKAIQSLVVEGKFKAMMMGRPSQGDLKIETLLPDKYLRTASLNTGMTILQCVNGEQVWLDSKMPPMGGGGGDFGGGGGGFGGGGDGAGGGGFGGGGGGGGGFGGGGGGGRGGGRGGGGMGGMGGGGGAGRPGGGMGAMMNTPGMQRQVRSDYHQLMLAWFLTPPANLAVEYLFERELPAQDGKVDVVRVTGPDNFIMWLLLDQKSHRPAGYVYRMMPQQRPNNTTDAREATEPKEINVQVFFADYKAEGNIQLPHQITKISNGQPMEELKISKVKFNEKLKDKKFEKKS